MMQNAVNHNSSNVHLLLRKKDNHIGSKHELVTSPTNITALSVRGCFVIVIELLCLSSALECR